MKCPRCSSKVIIKSGYVITVSRGKEQRRKCQKCGHQFTCSSTGRGNGEVRKG